MADNHQLADGNNDDDIFVYTGGDQEVPRDVKRVRIAENVDTIPARLFFSCRQLIEVKGHNKLKKIEEWGFHLCSSLRRVTKINGVIEIGDLAFHNCHELSDVELDKVETIGFGAFARWHSLRSINLPSVRRSGKNAFQDCTKLTDAKFGEDLEEIERGTFTGCTAMRRIVIPLKNNLIVSNDAFNRCDNLVRVDALAGGTHKTISSLHMESWRDEMSEEIDSINQTLPDTSSEKKGAAINQWIESVLRRMEHYKEEHHVFVKEAMTLLELALWKAKLLDEEGMKCEAEEKMSQKAKIDVNSAREERRVTCGANIVIKNVLPFLLLE